MTGYLDCSAEVSAFRAEVPRRRCWVAADIRPQQWLLVIDEPVKDEIRRLADFIIDNPVQNFQRRASEFDLGCCRPLLRRMKTILDDGAGFAVLDRMPLDEYPIEAMIEVYWILGQMVGRPVPQKWNGQMIYDVRDTGQEYVYGVRGSHTKVELVFHTDNQCFRSHAPRLRRPDVSISGVVRGREPFLQLVFRAPENARTQSAGAAPPLSANVLRPAERTQRGCTAGMLGAVLQLAK